ncbi:ArnT family glycosyltransferase [Companilactobacillus furfuricola]|uniref:ArnT family glycosyltransferase n=1 Tax=Companilactobacillus furfuricola TaxID=1462575 RepID=UPI001FE54A6C|nr:glycosyltransferase family 39 protein [Companilactobacillus furfuricola]
MANRLTILAMMLVFVIVSLLWINFVPKTQISDFGNFWSRVTGILKGDLLYYTNQDYFAKWAYQTGFMAYILLLVKIFGFHILPVQLLNILYQVFTILLIYKITLKIFKNVKMARISAFLLMIDLDWFAISSQADNQYLGSFLFLLTFYLVLQNKYWSYLLAGICLALGAIIRPIGPVIIAGIIVYAIVYAIVNNNSIHIEQLWKLLVLLGMYFLIFNGAGLLIKSSGLNQYGLSNRDPGWKFAVGLNYRSGGTYDQKLFEQINTNKNQQQMKQEEKKILTDEISYLNKNHKWLSLFQKKISTSWSSSSHAIDFTSVNTKVSPRTYQKLTLLGYLGSIIIILFSWIGSFVLYKMKEYQGIFLLILPFLAFAVVQLFIEVQGRYRIEFIPILAIISSIGMMEIVKRIPTIFHQRKQIE